MAQKINPTSIKIGHQSPWIFICQLYGKSKSDFSFFFIFFHFLNFHFLNFHFFSFPSNLFILSNRYYFVINSGKLKNTSTKSNLLELKYFPVKKFKAKSRFFSVAKVLTFASGVSFYFKFLVTKKIIFRKALLILIKLLKSQLNLTKIVPLKFGLKKLTLKGFKCVLTGRFENSKTQMAKKLEFSEGSVALLTTNSSVEFFNLNIYSKLGVCNFKIWLFYCYK